MHFDDFRANNVPGLFRRAFLCAQCTKNRERSQQTKEVEQFHDEIGAAYRTTPRITNAPLP